MKDIQQLIDFIRPARRERLRELLALLMVNWFTEKIDRKS